MAVIEKRTRRDGVVSYRARVRLQGHPEFTQTFAKKTDARDWARDIEAKLKGGKHLPSRDAQRRTVAQLIDRYLQHTLTRKARNRDAGKQGALLGWWKTEIGDLAVANVTPAVVAEARDKLLSGTTKRKKPRSPATVNRYLAALSSAFKAAVKEYHWCEANPVAAVAKGAESPGVIRFLDDAERDRLLKACRASQADYLYLLVLLAVTTGARRAELLGLTWQDVDLKRGIATFHRTKNRERRAVPIVGEALELLRARARVRRIDTALVFPGVAGKPLTVDTAWKAALARAEITGFRFHDLRHTAASYLAMSGATAPEIAAVLGHKTLQMVKRYAHLGEQHTAAVVERMTSKFFGAGQADPGKSGA